MGTVTLLHDEHFVERANDFVPERFLKKSVEGCPNAKDIHPFLLIPFGFGARACIGRRFAEMEIEVLTIRYDEIFALVIHLVVIPNRNVDCFDSSKLNGTMVPYNLRMHWL